MSESISDEGIDTIMRLANCGARTGLATFQSLRLEGHRRDLAVAMATNTDIVPATDALKIFYDALGVIRNNRTQFTPDEALSNDLRALKEGVTKFQRAARFTDQHRLAAG